MPEILDVGLMPYLNSAVFYKRMAPGAANLVEYTPREMALAVERGDLAAGPLPVAEWFRMGEMLTPIGDLCVATRQSSVSILLFGVRMPEEMEGARIAVTEQTATSVQLLRVLLNELWGVEPDALVTRDEPHDAILLIGDQISAPEAVFWAAAFVIVVGALGAVLLPNVVHSALSLIATLLGVAGIYLLLTAEFIALVQVLVYGGGVIILLLFGLMMTNAQDDPIVTDGSQKPFAFGVAIALGAIFVTAAVDADWGSPEVSIVAFQDFGVRLFADFMLPVILIAVLLDIALTGAFINARGGGELAPAGDGDNEAEAAS